jgi:hypothetical protein
MSIALICRSGHGNIRNSPAFCRPGDPMSMRQLVAESLTQPDVENGGKRLNESLGGCDVSCDVNVDAPVLAY